MPGYRLKKGQPVPSVADFAVGGMAVAGKAGKALQKAPAALRGLLRAVKSNITEGALERMIRETAELPAQRWQAPPVQPANRWLMGHAPKPGGVLNEVLSRAGEKQGIGEAVTPGESDLLRQFSQFIGNRRR